MGLISRIGEMITRAGAAVTRVGQPPAAHPPADGPRDVDGLPRSPIVSPGVELPGVTPWGGGGRGIPGGNVNEELARALGNPEAYLGRWSYDAGPGMARYSSNPATDLTPDKIAGAQQEAAAGWPQRWMEMIEQVLARDGHLSGIGQQRVDDVLKGPWRLARSTNDDIALAVRNFCDEALRSNDSLGDALGWMLWGNAYSYGCAETTWKIDRLTFPGPNGKRIGPISVFVPARFDAVHGKHFRFDMRTDEPLLWLGGDHISLPYGKFLFYKGEGMHPITERRGYMWPCVWYSMFRSIGWSGWATLVERFGMPVPLIEYQGTIMQYREYKQAYSDILNNLGAGRGAIYPRGAVNMKIEDPAGGGRAGDPHSALSDACDAAQSVRILGATLTAKISNTGSFAASNTHAEVKYSREEADARRLWDTVRQDLLSPMVLFNCWELAKALNAVGISCTPGEILRRVPRGLHRVPRDIDMGAAMNILKTAVVDLGMRVGAEATYDTFNLPQPNGDDDVIAGKAQPVSRGGALVGAVEAANEGAEAPPDETANGGAPPRELPARASRFERTSVTIAEPAHGNLVITETAPGRLAIVYDFNPGDHPRAADGKFGPGGGGAAGGGDHGAPPTEPQPDGGSSSGGSSQPTTTPAAAAPSAPAEKPATKREENKQAVSERKAARVEKRAAAEKAHAERREARTAARTARVEAKAAKVKAREEKRAAREASQQAKAERKAARVERQRARAEKKAAFAEKKTARAEAVKQLGAARRPDGKIDAAKVPGASKNYRVATTEDPEMGYKGRSFLATSTRDQMAEFLSAGATGGGGLNDHVLTEAMGTAGKTVRDPATFDAVSEKYGKKVETFEDAFKLLCGDPSTKNGKRDWRNFDIDTLRECRGFERVELPGWLHEAANAHQVRTKMADYYEGAYGGGGYHETHADQSELPF